MQVKINKEDLEELLDVYRNYYACDKYQDEQDFIKKIERILYEDRI